MNALPPAPSGRYWGIPKMGDVISSSMSWVCLSVSTQLEMPKTLSPGCHQGQPDAWTASAGSSRCGAASPPEFLPDVWAQETQLHSYSLGHVTIDEDRDKDCLVN